MPPFGMAGFAEGMWAQMIGELWLGTIIIAVLTLTALVRRSIRYAAAALVVDVVVALLYFPWMAFFAATSDDTDRQSVLSAWRTATTAWVGISIAAGGVTLWLVGWDSRRREHLATEPNPHKAF
jgi:hypothetical protein